MIHLELEPREARAVLSAVELFRDILREANTTGTPERPLAVESAHLRMVSALERSEMESA